MGGRRHLRAGVVIISLALAGQEEGRSFSIKLSLCDSYSWSAMSAYASLN
jgi:hypothetical protein